MAALLEISGIRSRYGSVPVLHGIDIAVAPGEVRLLIGRNGSGKSTTLKAVAGLVSIDAGSIRLAGAEIARDTTRARVLNGVSLVPQAGNRGRGVFPHLTVMENLELMALVGGAREAPPPYDMAWRLFPDLKPVTGKRAAALSGGQQQMLAVAMALMTRPRLLLLDEPTCGLARGRAIELMRVVRRLATDEGLAILLVEQNVSLTLEFIDRVSALRSGQVVAEVAPDVLQDPSWFARVL